MVKGHQEIHRQCLEERFLLNAWMAAGEVLGYHCTWEDLKKQKMKKEVYSYANRSFYASTQFSIMEEMCTYGCSKAKWAGLLNSFVQLYTSRIFFSQQY